MLQLCSPHVVKYVVVILHTFFLNEGALNGPVSLIPEKVVPETIHC